MAGSDTSVDAFQDYNNNICNSDAGFWLEMLTDSSYQSDAQFNPELQDKQLKAWPSFRDDQWGSGFEQQPSPKKKKKKKRKMNLDMSRCSTVNSASDLSEALTTISADLSLSLSSSSSFSDSSSEKSDPDNPREIADTPGTHSSLVERNGNHMLPSDSNINEIQIESTLDTGEGLRKVNFPVPEVGMEFCSEEDAYNFYVSYAKQIGFRVRKGKVQRSSNGDIRKRYFFCSREGFRLKKQSNKKTKYNRKETRTGCNAKIECTVESGKWVVSRFFEEHNHDLEDHMNVESQTRRSGTRLVINLNNEASMEPVAEATNFVKSYSIDCIAHVRDTKAYGLKPENAQNLINYLRRLQAEDPSFFHTVQLDADCRFTNIFWRDGRSKGDYDYFGDVIILDTTFKLDKYGMICAPFMGINHHRQFILFGCAFLLDESTDSFIWLLETFMEAMGRRQPKTIITDEGQAMVDAVKLMMPEARHQIGLWYIHRNASMHLSSCFEQPGLKKLFGECISECETEEEFESRWTSLLEKFHLRGNEWLANLHSSRDRWCHIFSRKTFSAGIQCYARIDSVFQNLAGHSDTMRLSAYVEQYFRAAKQQRREELYEDSHCNETEADMILDSCPAGLSEKQAASLYTCTMFKLFQKQLPMFLLVTVLEVTDDGRIATYKLSEAGKKKAFFVELNCLDSTIACCCKKYESDGILCVHALKVLIERNIYEIPPQYILKRWTKSAKDVAVAVYHGKALNTTAKSAAVLENKRSKCVSVLKQRINRVSEPGSADGPSRGFDVNRLSAEETEEGAALSSPNSAASSFQMDFEIISSSGGDRSHERDFEDVETQRASSRASDDEENGLTRKKLRLTKEQSAFLEGSFKEHSTLNPKQKFALAKQLNLLPS